MGVINIKLQIVVMVGASGVMAGDAMQGGHWGIQL